MLFLWCSIPFRLVISDSNCWYTVRVCTNTAVAPTPRPHTHTHTLTLSLTHTHVHILSHTMQSITVPAQGLLNALVYGWTREDFVHTIMHRRETSASHFSDEGSAINSGSYRSSILASRALSVNKGYSNSRSYRSLNSTSGKFKWIKLEICCGWLSFYWCGNYVFVCVNGLLWEDYYWCQVSIYSGLLLFCIVVLFLNVIVFVLRPLFVNMVAIVVFDLLHNVLIFMSYAYAMRGVESIAMTIWICTVWLSISAAVQ